MLFVANSSSYLTRTQLYFIIMSHAKMAAVFKKAVQWSHLGETDGTPKMRRMPPWLPNNKEPGVWNKDTTEY